MSKLSIVLIVLLISAAEVECRSRRRRRGIWPDILAPGGNTFAASGYYGMQSYIAYPESGIAFNAVNQPWNTYWPNSYQPNPFNNNYYPYPSNQAYPFNNNQPMFYGSPAMSNGLPVSGQTNYNGYYPSRAANLWAPPSNSMARPFSPRSHADLLRSNLVDSSNNPENT